MDVLEGLGYVYAMSAPAYLWLAVFSGHALGEMNEYGMANKSTYEIRALLIVRR